MWTTRLNDKIYIIYNQAVLFDVTIKYNNLSNQWNGLRVNKYVPFLSVNETGEYRIISTIAEIRSSVETCYAYLIRKAD